MSRHARIWITAIALGLFGGAFIWLAAKLIPAETSDARTEILGWLGACVLALVSALVGQIINGRKAPQSPDRDSAHAVRPSVIDKIERKFVTENLGLLFSDYESDQQTNYLRGVYLPLKKTWCPDMLLRGAPTPIPVERSDTPLAISLAEAYAQSGERLLILGQPGAGKTIALTKLVEVLLTRCVEQDYQPVPYIFRLVEWAHRRGAAVDEQLLDWMATQLSRDHILSTTTARFWLEQGWVVPLLDGLDEVPEGPLRRSCVAAINAYRNPVAPPALVVTSRIEQYERLQPSERLDLGRAMLLEPFTRSQVEDYLQRIHREHQSDFHDPDEHMRLVMGVYSSPGYADLISTPLVLWALCQVPTEQLVVSVSDLTKSSEPSYGPLWRTYVATRFKGPRYQPASPDRTAGMYGRVRRLARRIVRQRPYRYAEDHIHRVLSWVAARMSDSLGLFYVEDLQPSWLPRPDKAVLYHMIYRGLEGLAYGFAVGVVLGVPACLALGLAWGMALGVFLGTLQGRVHDSTEEPASSEPCIAVDASADAPVLPPAITGGVALGIAFGLGMAMLWGAITTRACGIAVGVAWSVTVIVAWGVRNLRRMDRGLSMESLSAPDRRRWDTSPSSVLWALTVILGMGAVMGLARSLAWGITEGITNGVASGLALGATWSVSHLQRSESDQGRRTDPNQVLGDAWRSAWKPALISFAVGAILILTWRLMVWPSVAMWLQHNTSVPQIAITNADCKFGSSLPVLLAVPLLLGMLTSHGGAFAVGHLALRLIMRNAGVIPLFFGDLLIQAESLGLLRRDGGGYRFLHPTMKNWFSAQYFDSDAKLHVGGLTMFHRIVDLPRWLHELFGPRARLSTVVLALATAALAGVLSALGLAQDGVSGWRMALTSLIMLDIAGGVVANLSSATNGHYRAQDYRVRLAFLAMHVAHPLLLWVAIPGAWAILLPATLMTLAAAFAVNAIDNPEFQQNVAAACLVVGTLVCCMIPVASEVLYAFCPLFMAKLALGFAVRRPSFVES